jgi:hypothetical protein
VRTFNDLRGEPVIGDRARYLATDDRAFEQHRIGPEFLYAAIVNVIGAVVMVNLGRLAERTGGKSVVLVRDKSRALVADFGLAFLACGNAAPIGFISRAGCDFAAPMRFKRTGEARTHL